MKGAKGGIRDRFISLLYSNKNQEEKSIEEELENKELLKKEKLNKKKKEMAIDDSSDISYTESHTDKVTEELVDTPEIANENIPLEKSKTIEDTPVVDKSEPSNEKEIHNQTQTFDTPVVDRSVPSNDKDIPRTETHVFDTPIVDRAVPSNDKAVNTKQSQTIDTPVMDKSEPTSEIKTDTPIITTTQQTKSNVGRTGAEEHEITIESEEKIQVNNELEELFLEKSVVSSLERIIKEDIYELEQIKYELEVLNQKEDEEVLKEEVETLKQRLDVLVRKFEKIKEEYYSSRDLDQFNIDRDLLYDIVLNYKDNVKDNNLVLVAEAEISAIESYVSLLDQITAVEIFTDDLDKKIDDKLDKFEIRDEQFEEMKLEYENVEELTSIIDKFNNQQDQILKDMEDKLDKSEQISHEIVRTTELVPHFERLFESALMMAASSKIPPTPRGNMIKAAMTITAIANAARFITAEERTKEVTKIKYTDYSGDLKNIKGEITSVLEKMDSAFDNIEAIREKFKHDCGEYASQIKEYDEFMKNLDRIEAELKLKQSIAIKYNKDFDKMLEKNNQKVKRLETLENAQAA